MKFREIPVQRNPKCPICGVEPTIKEVSDEWDALVKCDLEKA
jgi:DNA-binding HxlR family transcriptional regulator